MGIAASSLMAQARVELDMSVLSESGGADAVQEDRACPGGLGTDGAGRPHRTSSKPIALAIEEGNLEGA